MKTRLKEARKAMGLTQQQAAEQFGVSLGTYRNWEQGRVVMNGEQLVTAAQLLGTDVDYLLLTDNSDESSEAELVECFQDMSAIGREALLVVARDFVKLFPSEG